MVQGRAFGILDGGRGLIAAGAATFAVFLLGRFLPGDSAIFTIGQRTEALKTIIYFYTFLTFSASFMVWFFIPDLKEDALSSNKSIIFSIKKVLGNRLVWLQAVVVVCSYCGYKGIDYYSLYATDVLNLNEVNAARLVANASYIRVFAAICAGILVDRFSATKVISLTFLILLISYIALALLSPTNNTINIIYSNLILTFAAVYALRGVYFALLEEVKVERLITGTAVGFISVIGYTPDVFFNSIAGRILDASNSPVGFHNFFIFLAGFSVLGLFATLIMNYTNKLRINNPEY